MRKILSLLSIMGLFAVLLNTSPAFAQTEGETPPETELAVDFNELVELESGDSIGTDLTPVEDQEFTFESPIVRWEQSEAREGETFTALWDDAALGDSENYLLLIKDWETDSIVREDIVFRAFYPGSFTLSPLVVTESVAISIVPLDENNEELAERVWSEPVFFSNDGVSELPEGRSVEVGSAVFSSFFAAQLNSSSECFLNGSGAAPCTDFSFQGGVITDLWGQLASGSGFTQFAGAYTLAAPHLDSPSGAQDVRNPYGLGFCVIEAAGQAGGISQPILYQGPTPSHYNDAFGDGDQTRQGAANWIIAHFGLNTSWDLFSATELTPVQDPDDSPIGGGLDGLYWSRNDVTYSATERLVAVHQAVRILLEPSVSFPLSANDVTSQDTADLANWFVTMAANFPSDIGTNSNNLSLEVVQINNNNNTIQLQATANGNPIPHLIVKLEEGSDIGVNFSNTSNPEDDGLGDSTSQFDSWDYSGQNALAARTDENGIVTFAFDDIISDWRADFFVEVPGPTVNLWSGATSGTPGVNNGQFTAGVGEVWRADANVEVFDTEELLLIKVDQDGNPLSGAEIDIRIPANQNLARFLIGLVIDDFTITDPTLRDELTTIINNASSVEEGLLNAIDELLSDPRFTNSPEGGMLMGEFVNLIMERATGASVPNSVSNPIAIQINTTDYTVTEFIFEQFWSNSYMTQMSDNYLFGNLLASVTTPNNGEIALSQLQIPWVQVNEITPPDGYTIDSSRILVSAITNDEFEIVNTEEEDAQVRIRKIDAITGEPLAGATFDIYFDSDDNGTFETLVAEGLESGNTGYTPLYEGAPGTYSAVEVTPPSGYVTLTEPVEITVDNGGLGTAILENYPQISLVTEASVTEAQIGQLGVANPVSDIVTLTGLGEDEIAQIEIELFGPFETDELNTSGEPNASFLVESQNFGVTGNGPHVLGDFRLDEAGYYTFVATATVPSGDEPNRIATHEFGIVEETFLVLANPLEITTQAEVSELEIGPDGTATIYDTAFVTGLDDGEEGTITTILYGPYDSVEAMLADGGSDAFLVGTVTDDVIGTSEDVDEFNSTPFTITEAGVYTFVERITTDPDNDGAPNREADHEFGDPAETFVTSERPLEITTQAEVSELEIGPDGTATIYDTAFVTGLDDGEEGTITTILYGPYDSVEAMLADGGSDAFLVGTVTDDVIGTILETDQFNSTPFTITEAGVYTFVERITTDPDNDGVPNREADHEFGDPAETFVTSERPLEIRTEAEVSVLQLGPDGTATIYDTAFVTGLDDGEEGTITTILYGPYESRAAMIADGGSDAFLVSSVADDVVGSSVEVDVYNSSSFIIDAEGVYTFVEIIETDPDNDGDPERIATHEFGVDEETFVASQRPLTITTQASQAELTINASGTAQVTDTAFVTGLADGEEGTIETILYGPYDSVEAMLADGGSDAFLVGTVTDDVIGTSEDVDEFVSSPFNIQQAGVYVFVESITVDTNDDGTIDRFADHAFGLAEETFVANDRVFSLDTTLSGAGSLSSITSNGVSTISDVVRLGPVDGLTGSGLLAGDNVTISVGLYGPFNTNDTSSFVCNASNLVGSNSVTVVAEGASLTETIPVTFTDGEPGFYTFIASATIPRAAGPDVIVAHDCGLVTESGLVTPNEGTLLARKFNTRDPNAAIPGATYSVWIRTDNLPDGQDIAYLPFYSDGGSDVTNPNENGAEGTYGYITSGVTDANGRIALAAPLGAEYCLVEESAPEGFLIDDTARCQVLTDEVAAANASASPTFLSLPEEPSSTPTPRTGANTTWILLGGVIITLMALGTGSYSYRRKELT